MKQITVEVTREDIDRGWTRDPTMCPVALAITRRLARHQRVAVYRSVIDFYRGDKKLDHYTQSGSVATPKVAARFIRHFDERPGHPRSLFLPFSFDMDVPDGVLP